ncbi:MAG: glycosyltransferase [Bacteroidia bacterium]|nr:glycosyltransferase [Bacteroidia bacterium]
MSFLLGLIILLPYFLFWGMVLRSNHRTVKSEPSNSPLPKITLICSIRNEERLLPVFLKNLNKIESENPHHLQYILIDDQSTDNTPQLLHDFLRSINYADRISVLQTSPEKSGKKQALNLAFQQTQTEWAYVTDADCITNWKAINFLTEAIKSDAKAVFGPVIYTGNSSFLQAYQILENSALMALGSYQSARNNKTMGNAANMLVHVNSFLKINPFDANLEVAGGDDIFLIEAFNQANINVETVTNPNASVYTPVLETWRELWHQRIRWAQKSRFQSQRNTQNSQILMVLFFILLWTITLLYLNFAHYVELAGMWGTKIIFDVFLLEKITRFYQQKSSIKHRMASSVFQSIYIPIIAFAQFFSKVHWKDRSY